jgi:F-type H+-transporting ATPase subunit gamma
MITKKQLATEVEGLESLKSLVEVYEEVAAGRMQKVRGAVLQSRQFLEDLLTVFSRVKVAYRESAKKFAPWRRKNGKTVAVFVSANAGLYGDIVDRTFKMFEDFVKSEKPQVVVLGKLGVKMMADRLPEVLYNYFDFSDEGVDMESFDMVMRYLIQFERILVFYGKFKTILYQDPVMSSVSGDAVEVEKIEEAVSTDKTKFLFEPSVEEVAQVFEGEILASLFEQTLHESQLSKFASRMLSLDKAVDNIENRLKGITIEGRKIKHKLQNRKQLSTISGISLWS